MMPGVSVIANPRLLLAPRGLTNDTEKYAWKIGFWMGHDRHVVQARLELKTVHPAPKFVLLIRQNGFSCTGFLIVLNGSFVGKYGKHDYKTPSNCTLQ